MSEEYKDFKSTARKPRSSRQQTSNVTAEGNPIDVANYKHFLRSVLLPSMLTPDGFLKTPDGSAEPISIINNSLFSKIWELFRSGLRRPYGMGSETTLKPTQQSDGAYYAGCLPYKAFRHAIRPRRQSMGQTEYDACMRELNELIDRNNPLDDEISLIGRRSRGTLAHEAFHDIQAYLYDYHPDIIDELNKHVLRLEDDIRAWYEAPDNNCFRGYPLNYLFPTLADVLVTPSPYGPSLLEAFRSRHRREFGSYELSVNALAAVLESDMEVMRLEVLPILMGAAAEGNADGAVLISEILSASGLNASFLDAMNMSDVGIT